MELGGLPEPAQSSSAPAFSHFSRARLVGSRFTVTILGKREGRIFSLKNAASYHGGHFLSAIYIRSRSLVPPLSLYNRGHTKREHQYYYERTINMGNPIYAWTKNEKEACAMLLLVPATL